MEETPLLGIAAGNHAEDLATIENLCQRWRVTKTQAAVLRWFLDQGAHIRRDLVYHAKSLERSMWIDAKQRAIQSAVRFWRQIRVLVIEPRFARNGASLPPLAWIDWGSVLQRIAMGCDSDRRSVAGGPPALRPRGPGSVQGLAAMGFERDEGALSSGHGPDPAEAAQGACHAGDHDNGRVPTPAATSGGPGAWHAPGANAPGASPPLLEPWVQMHRVQRPPDGCPGANPPLLPGALESPARVLARARGLSHTDRLHTVVDVDSVRSVSDEEVRDLARKTAADLGWRLSRDQRVTLFAAAAAAKLLFSLRWLDRAVASTLDACRQWDQDRRPHRPWKYFLACLANNCEETEPIGPFAEPKNRTRTSFFGAVMQALEQALESHVPPDPPKEQSALSDQPGQETPAAPPMTPAELAEGLEESKVGREYLARKRARCVKAHGP